MQSDFAAGALLRRINDASVERPRIYVQTDSTLVELARIDYSMYGICGVHCTGMGEVHLHGVERLQLAAPGRQILMNKVEVFYVKPAEWNRHPAVLVAMIMNGTGLAYLPANGHQLIEWSAIDQIARVVLTVPGEIRCEGLDIDRPLREELA